MRQLHFPFWIGVAVLSATLVGFGLGAGGKSLSQRQEPREVFGYGYPDHVMRDEGVVVKADYYPLYGGVGSTVEMADGRVFLLRMPEGMIFPFKEGATNRFSYTGEGKLVSVSLSLDSIREMPLITD